MEHHRPPPPHHHHHPRSATRSHQSGDQTPDKLMLISPHLIDLINHLFVNIIRTPTPISYLNNSHRNTHLRPAPSASPSLTGGREYLQTFSKFTMKKQENTTVFTCPSSSRSFQVVLYRGNHSASNITEQQTEKNQRKHVPVSTRQQRQQRYLQMQAKVSEKSYLTICLV